MQDPLFEELYIIDCAIRLCLYNCVFLIVQDDCVCVIGFSRLNRMIVFVELCFLDCARSKVWRIVFSRLYITICVCIIVFSRLCNTIVFV